ncbi:hypothetical protein [Cupriavidus agavae]|uniref:Uncharacterized protein n=1 Tax=Cupriavidus agavae TaxID=1001822 RepID=A0A4Q7RU39_9BURK|nr:hypothetical protein [Cupriavidus agavae]RZT36468.1 hypothetical protein EV147_3789 [Cupriavidus agavae]
MIEANRIPAPARPLGLLAALLLCTALTACGGDGDSGTPSTGTPGGTTPTAPAVKPAGVKCAP